MISSPAMANQYDFTPELKKEIQQKIFRYWRQPAPCPVCQQLQWEMPDGFAVVSLLKNVWTNDRTSGLPCAAFICTTCGYTMLFNLIALGFERSIGPDTKKILEDIRARRNW